MLTIYLIYCLTDYIQDPFVRSTYIGGLMLLITGINMVINLGPLVAEIFRSIVKKCRGKYHSCRNAHRRKAKKESALS